MQLGKTSYKVLESLVTDVSRHQTGAMELYNVSFLLDPLYVENAANFGDV
jgi:hypothetical protein